MGCCRVIYSNVYRNYCMNKDLRNKIEEFNRIKYLKDDSKRIIIATLKTEGTVTTAPIYKE